MNANSQRLLENAEGVLRRTWQIEKQLKEAKREYKDNMITFASSMASELGVRVTDIISDDGGAYEPFSVNHFEAIDMRGENGDPNKQWLIWAIGDNGERMPINGRYQIKVVSNGCL